MSNKLSPEQEALLTALCYGEVFQFPLARDEFKIYSPLQNISEESLSLNLQFLEEQGLITRAGAYYSFPGNEDFYQGRTSKNKHYQEKWRTINACIPQLIRHSWIKAVLLTGSMAAKNPDGKADADLLLVLDTKRIWIGYLWVRLWCRFKRKGLFCPNYVLSENHLKLNFPNYFTAVEYAMAVPLKTNGALLRMEMENPWLREMLPNCQPFSERTQELPYKPTLFSKLVDLLVASSIGWFLNFLEYRRLRRKTKSAYMPSPGVYKPHAPTRQLRIINELLESMDKRKLSFNIFRRHLEKGLRELEKAEEQWFAQLGSPSPSKLKPCVREACSRHPQ